MGKNKKKKKNKPKDFGTFGQLIQRGGGTVNPKESLEFEPREVSEGSLAKTKVKGVSIGKKIDRSKDKFFLGSDYREIFIEEREWADMLVDVEHWTPLAYTHGIEMELIIADDDGNYPDGDEMVYRMKEIVKEAIKIMKEILYEGRSDFLPVPDYIRQKVLTEPYGKEDIEKGYVMDIRYQVKNDSVDIDTFGRDGNVTAITYILELVTPPCAYVEELAYWASTLFLLAKNTLPSDLHIIASAINPATKEYQRGLSQADHHHIDAFDTNLEKVQAYSMIRNFIPHIIALTCNSPILNNQPTDVVKIINDRITAPNCVRSLRLKNNDSMLSSNDPKHYIPYLTGGEQEDKQHFMDVIQKASLEDAKYQDAFPFTEFGTIELRISDAQISICRRIGIALLIQALCFKAKKLLKKGVWVPDAGSETIITNRNGAIERGLISLFRPKNITRDFLSQYDPDFATQYLGPEDNPVRYMMQAVQRMFFYIRDELKELGFLYSPFLKPVLQSVFGNVSYAEPPITEAEYQLSLYDYKVKSGENPNILYDLIYFTIQYCQDPLNNPLTGTLTLPKEMR
ncbi:MAG: Carboxylate-amine ligase YbdK [Promethearchaeota archaeon]|nr:MAG: Carboxylate-amine ligase YbdK [Candidatus Lokiarchaeota archaeon]